MSKYRKTCYYSSVGCNGPLWTCGTCKECFCKTHSHVTDKGRNIECAACEFARQNEAKLASTDARIERQAKLADPGNKLN